MTAVAPHTHPATAPVAGTTVREPVDTGVLHGLVTRWLRETRHGSGAAVCWACPVDAAGLVGRVEAAWLAGAL